MRFVVFLLSFVVSLGFINAQAFAACTSPAGEEGEMVYNIDHKMMQFCDGTDWIAMGGISPSAGGGGGSSVNPSGGVGCYVAVASDISCVEGFTSVGSRTCYYGFDGGVAQRACNVCCAGMKTFSEGGNPRYCHEEVISLTGVVTESNLHENKLCDTGKYCEGGVCKDLGSVSCSTPGERCPDGTLYVNGTIYTTDADQGRMAWKIANGTNDINPDSDTDGLANHTNRSGTLSDFPAFETCENLTAHGHSDWYLPSINELDLMMDYPTELGGIAAYYYWSSTEYNGNDAKSVNGGNGTIYTTAGSKTSSNFYVRCVRKD